MPIYANGSACAVLFRLPGTLGGNYVVASAAGDLAEVYVAERQPVAPGHGPARYQAVAMEAAVRDRLLEAGFATVQLQLLPPPILLHEIL